MNFSELLQQGRQQLERAGVAEAELDARLLLESVSGKNRTRLYLDGGVEAGELIECGFRRLLWRRCQREPVAYIIGEREFWSLPFYVNSNVLIPRPETEFLLETVFARAAAENFFRAALLDLCTGSGVIAVVLAKERPESRIIASDISPKALELARRNAVRHGVEGHLGFCCADLLRSFATGKFSLVVSNPPYIARQEVLEGLAPEVCNFEPHLALNGGEDGLALIRRIEKELPSCLLDGGDFFMEFGAGQGREVMAIFQNSRWHHVKIFQDYAGRDRVVWARRASIS